MLLKLLPTIVSLMTAQIQDPISIRPKSSIQAVSLERATQHIETAWVLPLHMQPEAAYGQATTHHRAPYAAIYLAHHRQTILRNTNLQSFACNSYLCLARQELRFIFPALPLFNLAAGVGMSKALRRAVSPSTGSKEKRDGHDGGGSGNSEDDDDSGGGTRRNVRCRMLQGSLFSCRKSRVTCCVGCRRQTVSVCLCDPICRPFSPLAIDVKSNVTTGAFFCCRSTYSMTMCFEVSAFLAFRHVHVNIRCRLGSCVGGAPIERMRGRRPSGVSLLFNFSSRVSGRD